MSTLRSLLRRLLGYFNLFWISWWLSFSSDHTLCLLLYLSDYLYQSILLRRWSSSSCFGRFLLILFFLLFNYCNPHFRLTLSCSSWFFRNRLKLHFLIAFYFFGEIFARSSPSRLSWLLVNLYFFFHYNIIWLLAFFKISSDPLDWLYRFLNFSQRSTCLIFCQ